MFAAIKALKEFNKLPADQRSFVFFSEGPNYFRTFMPILGEFSKRGVPFTYLTMDPRDPGLDLASENAAVFNLGSGTGFIYFMSMINADTVIMTTPGLQSLTIKRSPGVRRYVHIVHSPVGVSSYRKYSFDHFDAVMCSGPHQISEIRALEKARKSKEKTLLETGCVYMDTLKNQAVQTTLPEARPAGTDLKSGTATVLVAPTWGRNGALGRFGMNLLKPLMNAGYRIIIRPHPQQSTSEKKLLDKIRGATESYKNIRWDLDPSGHDSMAASDIMISDISGVLFDYAFIYEKPVLTLDFPFEAKGFEHEDIKGATWESTVRERLGAVIPEEELDAIPDRIQSMLNDPGSVAAIREVRDNSIFNFGTAGAIAAEQLFGIANSSKTR